MGGTSTDVCRIEGGRPEVAFERTVEGYACRLPSVAVHTVGAGGGSVGWVDAGGALRVGPRSAGATPGPASYGRGGAEATVTDADLLVGRLSADIALADELLLDVEAATAALEGLGNRLGLSIAETSLGVIEIVEAHMERAIRRVSVEEGFDPAGAALVAFGGAGGMHASALASRLGMDTVLVPPYAGTLSALGLLLSPPRMDAARTILVTPTDSERLAREVGALTSQVAAEFQSAVGAPARETTVALDMRYVGQSHETAVPWHGGDEGSSLTERFHAAHHQRNGFRRPEDPVEVVTVRATAVGTPTLRMSDLPEHSPVGEAVAGRRPVLTPAGVVDAVVHRRAGLPPGTVLPGPAIVVEDGSTTWIEGGSRGRMHESGTLVIERG
jgi:N-methylhydantoinase A